MELDVKNITHETRSGFVKGDEDICRSIPLQDEHKVRAYIQLQPPGDVESAAKLALLDENS